MDLTQSERSRALADRLQAFMRDFVYPAEEVYTRQRREGDPHRLPPIVADLQREARARGLWNLFMRHPEWGAGLSNLEYAPLAEISGRSPVIAPEAMNCSAPDTGNMELLAEFGTPEQQRQWLVPLDAPGVEVVRDLSTFGYSEQHGHGEVRFDAVRVPAGNLLGAPGGGFAMAQARLGPGRVHHCMRALGMAERALALMVRRAAERAPFGRPLAEQDPVGSWIAG